MKQLLTGINANHFFPTYASKVSNYQHKMRGKDGNDKPIEFSDKDIKLIKRGLKKMTSDILETLKN